MWSTPIRPTSLFLASQVAWGRWCRQLQTGGCPFHQPGLPIVVSHSIIGRQQSQTSVILLDETCCCEWDFVLLSQFEKWTLAGGQRQAVYLMLLHRPVGCVIDVYPPVASCLVVKMEVNSCFGGSRPLVNVYCVTAAWFVLDFSPKSHEASSTGEKNCLLAFIFTCCIITTNP